MFNANYYTHSSDKAALTALKAIPGFHQFTKAFMKIWHEPQFRISNMSSCVRINEKQLPEYYNMLPPICEKLGIDVPELYLSLDVTPNAGTYGETKPFIIINSGLFETLPEELIPTVLAHECGHIACHHVLYSTMGRIVLGHADSALRAFVPYGGLASIPLEVAFFYWMRCSELSADRAAVLCDGTAEKMSEVCLRLAGYDKDIRSLASKEEFMEQAREYRNMIRDSKWNKTLEFLSLMGKAHPLTTVRALECEEWAKTDQYQKILNGTYQPETGDEDSSYDPTVTFEKDSPAEASGRAKRGLSLFKRREKEELDVTLGQLSVPDEIRQYKALLDEGLLTEEEFAEKKRQLLNI